MDRFLTRLAIAIASAIVALLVVAVAFAFLCAAVYLAFLEITSPALAALFTGLAAILLAVLILVTGRLLSRCGNAPARRRARDDRSGDETSAAAEAGGILGAEIASFARANPKATLLASLAAGFAVGVSPKLRKTLLDLLLRR